MKYPMCTLSDILSPGTYIVTTADKEHVAEVRSLEENMRKEMSGQDAIDLELQPEMCVAVKDIKGDIARGIIHTKSEKDTYDIFLMDYGQIIRVKKSRIMIITNKDFVEIEPLAFMVKLYGLIPIKYSAFGNAGKPRASKEWCLESQEFVKKFFNYNSKIVVQSILIQERTVYGDLFVRDELKMKYVSLRKLLCKNQFCAYSETAFLKHEGLKVPTESVELNTKMEMVKKWQKENFGHFKKNAYQLPSPVSSPHETVSDISSLNVSEYKRGGEKIQVFHCDETEKRNPDTVSENVGRGRGRGRLKLILAEMKNKKQDVLPSSSGGSSSTDKMGTEPQKPPCGRGQTLRKVLNMIKSRATHAAFISAESKKDTDTFSDADVNNAPTTSTSTGNGKPPTGSKMERAVVRPGEFSEFSDSNGLTEVSLSTEDDAGTAPLLRNGSKKSNLESSELNGAESVCRNESKKPDEIKKSWEKLTLESEKKEGSCPEEEQIDLKCSKLKECGSWCSETNLKVWKRPSNLITSNSCWTPFVLFDDSVVESINNFRELPIQPSIIKNLERRGTYKNLSQVQRWAIPMIRKQLNTVMISGPKTGKTLSYLVPLMDYIQDEFYFEELPRGNGPFVVILASSSHMCEVIYYTCHHLLGHLQWSDVANSKVKIVMAHGSGREEEIWVSLTNGCHLLITTPPCLVRLLEFPVLTNFERLACLVLDEADIICDNPFRKLVRIIFEKAQLSTKDRHYQKILCGEKWTSSVANITKAYVKSYALVIGSYFEAVVYKGLKPSIFLMEKTQKAETLWEKLKGRIKESKSLIFCETTEEAVFLSDFLTGKGLSPLVAHEKMLAQNLKDTAQTWKYSAASVLIITDGVLGDLNIKDAQLLVHYSLPYKSKTNFFLRYSTVLNTYREKDSFQRNETVNKRPKVVHTVILVDDDDHYQLPHIAEFVTRLGEKLPPPIVDRCEDIRKMIEVGKSTSPICGNLLAFGRCRNSRHCPRRHAMVKAWDSPENLPASGWVSFDVVKTHDAAHFSARLLEHTDLEGNSVKFEDSSERIAAKLAEHFTDDNNWRPLGGPKVGSLCCVRKSSKEPSEGSFHRGKVVEYLKVDKYEMPVEVGVKLLDEGDVLKRKTSELYELPDDLSIFPPTAVDIRVVEVQPKDFDVTWSQAANEFAEDLMTRQLERNQYWSGKILLALNNTLFLDPIKRKEFLPHLNVHVFDMVVRGELLNHGIAVMNSEHLMPLLKLAKEVGIELPSRKITKTEDSAYIQPQWAFFDSDVAEVRFSAAENTSVVFLQAKKYQKQLEALEAECQKEGEKTAKELKAKPNADVPDHFDVGRFCLARFEDGNWNRGRIESLRDTDVQVFFVDHGDFLFVPKKNVVGISQKLLLRLPCQAIECRLVGIEDEKECPLEVLQEIYAFSEDGKQDLFAHVVSKESTACITRGRKYGVILVDPQGVSLNRMLVDAGKARGKESERCLLEKETERMEEEKSEGTEEEDGVKEDVFSDIFLTNLKDDVFEDEDGLAFLKEFASKVFPHLEDFQETPASKKREEKQPGTSPEVTKSKRNIRQLLELRKLRQNKSEKEPELKSREVLTPQVVWQQTQDEIRLKILLGNVSDYSFECTHRNFSFRCVLGEKFYAVDLKLFGAISPRLTKVWTKAFHVSVVMTKLAWPTWPRLPYDEGRHRWISADVEGLRDNENDFSESISAAKAEIESGHLKTGVRNEEVNPCSDVEDYEAESDSDSENSSDT